MSLVYDLYASFHKSSLDKVVTEFIQHLATKCGYKICIQGEEIHNARGFLVFITKKYCTTEACLNEIKYAFDAKKKPFLIVMLEEISIDDLGSVASLIVDKTRFTAYKELKLFQKQKGSCFDSLLNFICDELNEKEYQQPDPTYTSIIINSISTAQNDCTNQTAELVIVKNEQQKTESDKGFFKKIFQKPVVPTPVATVESQIPYFKKILKKSPLNLKSKHLRRIAIAPDKQQLYICDIYNNSILTTSLNGEFISSINPQNVLKGPCAICVDHKNMEIYISDWKIDRILVFNQNFKLLRDLGKMSKVDTAFDICFDTDTSNLFASDSNNDVVTILNGKTGQPVKHIEIDCPKHMKIFKENLYIVYHACMHIVIRFGSHSG